MPSESFDAAAGAFATLDAAPSPQFDGTHRIKAIYGADPDRAAVCGCGLRIDGADIAQVKELHRKHAIEQRYAAERERASEVTPERLPAIRADLERIASFKSGGPK